MHKLLLCSFVFVCCANTSVFAGEDNVKQIKELINREELKGYSGTYLVAEKGLVVSSGGAGYADRENKLKQTSETVFSIGSITKQFTAAAIMKLEAGGKLSSNDKLAGYFPNAPEDKKDINIHQLLTHTAGFEETLGDDYDTIGAAQFMALAMKSKLVGKPGENYLYSNVGYSILGIIVEKVSGKGYEQFLRDELFLPSGMKHTGYRLPGYRKEQLAVGYRDGTRWGTALDHPWAADGPGWHLRANGGILSTAGDMYNWYLSLRNNTVLPKSQTEKMFSPHVAEGPQHLSYYGYGWVVQNFGEGKMIWHNGGNGVYNAFAGFDPDQDLFIVVSSNTNNTVSDRIALELFNIVSAKAKVKLEEAEPDYRNNPVTRYIYKELVSNGANYFSQHSDEVLKKSGFDFENDMQLLGVGEQLEEEKKWDEGIALYTAYTLHFPRIAVAWNRLGICYREKGNFQKAKECWEKSIAVKPENNRAAVFLKELE